MTVSDAFCLDSVFCFSLMWWKMCSKVQVISIKRTWCKISILTCHLVFHFTCPVFKSCPLSDAYLFICLQNFVESGVIFLKPEWGWSALFCLVLTELYTFSQKKNPETSGIISSHGQIFILFLFLFEEKHDFNSVYETKILDRLFFFFLQCN